MPVDIPAVVISNTRLTSEYNVVSLAAPQVADVAAPGQFVMIKTSPGLDPLLRRPFSIFEILRDQAQASVGISLLNKRVGVGTALLYDARVGDRLDCLGPLGQPFVPVTPPEEAWMVAGGVGLAPFATLAQALAAKGTAMTLFYGGRSTSDLFYESFFAALGARLVLTTDDGSRGTPGRVTGPLEAALLVQPADHPVTLYACGPTPMMRAVADLGAAHARTTYVSLEPVMGCGMGGCYSCVVRVHRSDGTQLVRSCIDGPVFDSSTVVWDALSGGH
ncbi:MAG: dihydroorotate dehydrogenase electron transfer subunit [Acidobacteria bacterium]|jgi:dihydroorotate dehydrogenase electron transfer subunit|nr:dihydroorotate dehydrogenase electron transfer subunit [Acidobacteriota bacterium]